MTFPIPSMKLFTTESTCGQGKVDNKAEAVVNLTVNPSSEKLVEYREEKSETDNPYGSGVFVVNSSPKKTREVNETAVQTKESKLECFYRTVLEAYMNNPLIINKCVLMKTHVLAEFIKVLTDSDDVEVGIMTDVSCCGKPTDYNVIDNIVLVKDGIRNDFKVAENEWYRMLKDYRISLKFTVD